MTVKELIIAFIEGAIGMGIMFAPVMLEILHRCGIIGG